MSRTEKYYIFYDIKCLFCISRTLTYLMIQFFHKMILNDFSISFTCTVAFDNSLEMALHQS